MYFIENQLCVNLTNLSPLETSPFRILQHSRIVAARVNVAPCPSLDHLLSGFIALTLGQLNCAPLSLLAKAINLLAHYTKGTFF